MKKEYINEVAWGKILTFFSGVEGIYIGCHRKFKKFIEAIFWMARTGAQWRELPFCYGDWNSVFKRFNAWSKKNIWSKLLEYLAEDCDLEYVMIDATIVRAHACAAGYGEQPEQGLGRSAGGFTSKIHAKVDALGNLLKFVVTAGQVSDITQAHSLLADVHDAHVLGDKGYHSKDLKTMLESNDCNVVIPPKINTIEPWDYDKHLYKERHLIECFFSKIKYFRRVFSRFDKSIRNYASFVSFVGACLWLR